MPVLQGNIIIEDFSTNILKLTSENPVGFFNDYYLIKNGTRIVISNDPALTGWYTLIAHTGVSYQFWYGQVTSPVTIDGDQFEYILENWVYDTSKVQKNNTYVAQNQTLNFIEGANITLTITDDYPNKRTNIQINSVGAVGGVTTFSAGTTGLTPVAPTAGAVTLGGTLAITNGGTGLTALGAALQYLRVNAAVTALEYATLPAIPVVTPSALTASNDTNVTLTLGGTPATALLQATSITAGWTGTLAISRGGTGLGTTPTNGQLLIGNGTGYTLSTLTAGAGISITNAPGSITVNNTSPASGISVTGRQGDVIVSGASPTFTVSTVVSPFLLMGG